MRHVSSIKIAVAFAALFAVAGCGVHKPTMHIDHAEISGIQVVPAIPPQINVLMTVVINVYNPNSYDVAIRAMRGQVVLADHYQLPINFQAPTGGLWLPSEKTTQIRVPQLIPAQVAAGMLQQAVMTTQIPYHMTGKADVTATSTLKIEADDYSVDEQGFIDRTAIQASVASVFPGMAPR